MIEIYVFEVKKFSVYPGGVGGLSFCFLPFNKPGVSL